MSCLIIDDQALRNIDNSNKHISAGIAAVIEIEAVIGIGGSTSIVGAERTVVNR